MLSARIGKLLSKLISITATSAHLREDDSGKKGLMVLLKKILSSFVMIVGDAETENYYKISPEKD